MHAAGLIVSTPSCCAFDRFPPSAAEYQRTGDAQPCPGGRADRARTGGGPTDLLRAPPRRDGVLELFHEAEINTKAHGSSFICVAATAASLLALYLHFRVSP